MHYSNHRRNERGVLDALLDGLERRQDSSYIERARIYRAVGALTKAAGIDGDMFAPAVPQCGSLEEELLIIALLGKLPAPIRRHPLALKLLRAAVLTSESEVQHDL